MTQPRSVLPDAALYTDIQRFYAWQMQLLDDVKTTEWAATFTEDGVFAANGAPAPAVGRDVIATAAAATHEGLAAVSEVRRHWLGMMTVTPRDDDTVHTRCYALIIATRPGEASRIHCSTLCEDDLVRGDGGWLVRHRTVTRDDIRG